MNFRQRVGLAWGPLPLRLGLAVAFVWAGSGKVFETVPVSSSQAGALAAMGVNLGAATGAPTAAPGETPAAPNGSPKPAGPESPLPDPDKPTEGDPPKAPEAGSARGAGSPANGGGGRNTSKPGTTRAPSRKSQASAEGSGEPAMVGPGGVEIAPPRVAARTQDAPAPVAGGSPATVAYPDGVRVRSVYRIALLIESSAKAPVGVGGAPAGMPLWPAALAKGSAPVYLAWSVALVELIGGVLVLVGLLTRVWSVGLAGVMVGAVWLTQVGPAVQSGKAVLGFLPAHGAFDVAAWMPLQWQVALLCMSVSLVFIGPGAAALDNVLWGGEKKRPGPPPASKPA